MPKKTTPPRTRSAGTAARPTTRAELPFEVRRSAIQGRGAFATRRIRAGQRVIEYVGERISRDEGDRRYDDEHMGRHHTFLFALEDGSVIDAAIGGNESRFLNHSCDPNCQAIEEDGRIFIEAIRNIQPGTELVYDYAYERTDDHTEEDELLYVCRCGADNCRGSILAPRKPRSSAKKKR
ncbi:MAG: SET domain-containing protein [Gemmatimonadaceae bacterium]